jgi:methyl-accepting chemotaxis protein
MSIRAKLYTAIVVVVAGLALTAGVAIAAMSHLGDRFDAVQRASSARALALQLKFDVTDFNGWQTAYGYDEGKSRPIYLASFKRFERNLAKARAQLRTTREQRLLDRIERATDDFARLDDESWAALQAGRPEEVKRILLGPELVNFQRAAAAAQALAAFQTAQVAAENESFEDARSNALRLLVVCSIFAGLLVFILLLTASDLARLAESRLDEPDQSEANETGLPEGSD